MNLLEWVLDCYIHELVDIDEVQLGFVTDAILVVHKLWERFITANKLLFFFDLAKAFILCIEKSCGGP